jgi:rhomboid protease GluP
VTPIPAPRLPSPDDPIPVRAPAREPAEPPLWRRAPLTFAIIAVNLAVFVGETALGGLGGLAAMDGSVLRALGGNEVGATLYENRYETLLTSCFLHASLLHIAFNLWALRQIGPFVERSVGAARMAPLYLLSGIAASSGSTFMGWLSGAQRLSVGASGAICGLIGATLVIGYRVEGWRSPLMRAMAGWLLSLFALGMFVNVILLRHRVGSSGGFDNAAHFGGAIAGASIAAAWRRGATYATTVNAWVIVLCAAVVVGAGIRVTRFTLTNPLATKGVDDRVTLAVQAIDAGQCADARIAVTSLEHLAPRAPEVALVAQNYHLRCEH